jgi:hypothetical protein
LAQALARAAAGGVGAAGACDGDDGDAVVVEALQALGVDLGWAVDALEPLLWGVRVVLALLHPDQGAVIEAALDVVEGWLEGCGAVAVDEVASKEAGEGDEGGALGGLLRLTLALLGRMERQLAVEVRRASEGLWRGAVGRRRDGEAGGQEEEGAVAARLRLALWRGAMGEAKATWREAASAPDAATCAQAGRLFETLGDWERARGLFSQVTKAQGAQENARGGDAAPAGWAGLGRVAAALGEEEGARSALEVAFSGGYAHPRDAILLASLMLRAERLAEAERWRQVAEELGARRAWLAALDQALCAQALARASACARTGREAEALGCLALAAQYGGDLAATWRVEVSLAARGRAPDEAGALLLEALTSRGGEARGRALGAWMLGGALDAHAARAARGDGWLEAAAWCAAQLPDACGDIQPWHLVLVAAERLLADDPDTAQMAAQAGLQALMSADPGDDPTPLRADAAALWVAQAEAARRADDTPRAAAMLLHALRFSDPDAPLVVGAFLALAPRLPEPDLDAWLEALSDLLTPAAMAAFQAALSAPSALYPPPPPPPAPPPPEPLRARLAALLATAHVHLDDATLDDLTTTLLDALDLQRAERLDDPTLLDLLSARRRSPSSPAAPSSPSPTLLSASARPLRTLDPAPSLPWQRTQSARASDALHSKKTKD